MNLKIKNSFLAVALSSTALFLSCDKDEESDYKMSNQQFVTQASSSNSFEIAAGSLAMSKGEHDEVKDFGEQMVADHTAATAEMTLLANRKGLSISTEMTAHHEEMLSKLNQMSGDGFDKEFAKTMVASHQEAVTLFENASQPMGVPDSELRTMAAGKLPTLRMHLEHAGQLQTTVQ